MQSPYAIAVDLGATNSRVALVDQRGKIIKKLRRPTPREGARGTVITAALTEMIQKLMTTVPPDTHFQGIGISSIGPLDYKKGGPRNSPNIPFSFVPLVPPLKAQFSLPVLLLNDANAGVLAEHHFGAGKRIKNLVYVTLSTGIGGGAIVDGKLLFGRGGNAAEVGHLIVDTTYNLPCACAKGIGHWEAYASGRTIPRFFSEWTRAHKEKIEFNARDAETIFKKANEGNAMARAFLDELGRVNGRAVSDLIVAYDPELITFGGSVALHNSNVIIHGIKKYAEHYLARPAITITSLGEDITLLGAAAAVFQK